MEIPSEKGIRGGGMTIVFASPMVLFGLATGTIPIIIHRLTHQKTVKKRFSAVRLLIRSQKVIARPQRLKHLFLLALRISAIVAVVVMAARPTLVQPGLLAYGSSGSKVVIIDNSMSMGFQDGNGGRFPQAMEAGRTILSKLSGPVSIMPTVTPDNSGAMEDSGIANSSREALLQLSALKLTSRRGNPGAAIATAFGKLKRMTGQKEVVLISDLTRGDWQDLDQTTLGMIPSDVRLTVLRIGGQGRDSNWSIKDALIGSGGIFAGTPFPVTVRVANLADTAGQITVKVLIDSVKTDQKTLLLKPGEESAATFRIVTGHSGWCNGEFQLSPDNLNADNVFHFPLYVRDKAKIAVVDGDPRPTMRQSESYYLTRALLPGDSAEAPLHVQIFHEREFQEKDLSTYDELFLLNLRQPAPAKIANFLNSGKSVFIFLGDRVLPEEYNAMSFFPWRIRTLKDYGDKAEKITHLDFSNKALADFRDRGNTGLTSASFSRSFTIEGSLKPLLSLGNGDPLLFESTSGKGKLFLFASSADIDWNDLPLSTGYVPLLQGLVKGALTTPEFAASSAVGDGAAFDEKAVVGQVTGQAGSTGIYRVKLPGSTETRRALNVPFDESDLSKITVADLKKLLPGIPITVSEYRQGDEETLYGSRTDVWPYILAFLLLVLAAEMGVAQRI
jgi:hypothetical protein